MGFTIKQPDDGSFQIVDDDQGYVALNIAAGGLITKLGKTATTTAIASLTGTVGTANSAMTAQADLTATASVTALRDDVNTNLVAPLNANLADLQGKVNAILAALRGIIPAA
jgi:hypothetical protein